MNETVNASDADSSLLKLIESRGFLGCVHETGLNINCPFSVFNNSAQRELGPGTIEYRSPETRLNWAGVMTLDSFFYDPNTKNVIFSVAVLSADSGIVWSSLPLNLFIDEFKQIFRKREKLSNPEMKLGWGKKFLRRLGLP